MPTIEANGLTIGYEVAGAGPPMILLHGATSSGREQFATQVPILAPAFRLYLPDARGHASSVWDPRAGLSTTQMADDVLAFADALELETFHLLGYSMGAMTGLHVASRAPGRLRTFVAISIGAEREPRLAVGRVLMDPDRIEGHDPSWARELTARHDPFQGVGGWRRLLPAIVADIEAQPLLRPADLRAIDPPTLVAAGDRDPFVPVDQALALARQVRDGRLLVLPGVGHDALADRPELLHVALEDFYRSTASIARRRAGADASQEAAP
jgi:pimeloyl-ACP methyl ester carboxylesterase